MISLLSFEDASEFFIKSCGKIVKSLCGEKFFCREELLQFLMYLGRIKEDNGHIMILMSGVSPYTFVIWAPFHDLDDDGGVFYLDLEPSHSMISLKVN